MKEVSQQRAEHARALIRDFGLRVRALRSARGLSQESLAERAGLTTKFLSEIERAETNPSLTSVVQVAAALNVTLLDLVPNVNRDSPWPAVLGLKKWRQIMEVGHLLVETAERMMAFASEPSSPKRQGRASHRSMAVRTTTTRAKMVR
jgi:transcriptional regulator with XRE-family HTH domain